VDVSANQFFDKDNPLNFGEILDSGNSKGEFLPQIAKSNESVDANTTSIQQFDSIPQIKRKGNRKKFHVVDSQPVA
jgi:hypothetical protein